MDSGLNFLHNVARLADAGVVDYQPVVTEAYILNPFSLLFFLVFITFACFFLMSVALGVIFDLYIEVNYFTYMCSGSEAGSYPRNIDFYTEVIPLFRCSSRFESSI